LYESLNNFSQPVKVHLNFLSVLFLKFEVFSVLLLIIGLPSVSFRFWDLLSVSLLSCDLLSVSFRFKQMVLFPGEFYCVFSKQQKKGIVCYTQHTENQIHLYVFLHVKRGFVFVYKCNHILHI